MPAPPPIPPAPPRPPAGKSFAHHAATGSILAPILAVVIAFSGQSVAGTSSPETTVLVRLILGAASCFFIVVGLVLGIVGLCGISVHGRKGLLAPALGGTLFNGLLILLMIALAIPALLKARERAETNRENLARIKQAGEDIQAATRKEMTADSTNRQLSQKKMDELEKSVQSAAQNMTGDDALTMRASAAYVDQLNKLKKELDAATAELTAAKIMVAKDITDKQQLEAQREVVQKFLEANERSKQFIGHGKEKFREELVRWHVPDKIAEATLTGYRRTADAINPIVVEIRECDARIGRAMLEVVDLEEADWGTWDAKSKPGKIIFQNPDSNKKFNTLVADIRAASLDERDAQTRLLKVTKPTQTTQ